MQNDKVVMHILVFAYVLVEAALGLGTRGWVQDLTRVESKATAWGLTIG